MGIFKRQPQLIDWVDVESIKTTPFSKLIRLYLQTALEAGGSAVVFGVPAGVAWDWEALETLAAKTDEKTRQPGDGHTAPEQHETDWVDKSHLLSFGGGPYLIPIWLREGDAYRPLPVPHPGLPGRILIQVLWIFGYLRVAIDSTKEHPTPMRYIELEPRKPGTRRFAEVELAMAKDNTLQFQIFGVREEPDAVQADRKL